ncbi:calcium-binding protein [Microvirga sp. GCM10011540]|uniref:calcium-binding protein n=1 Tax=Microvirga sp. GCM10011540 TaxID=3317338 RepID=UPI00360F397F
MPTTIAIESKPVTLRGFFVTPYQHLYLVKTVTDDAGRVLDERVIRGDAGGDFTLVTQADIPLARSADARGSETPEQRNRTEIDLDGRDPEAVWQLMVQHAVNVDKADLLYGVDSFGFSTGDGANSNTLVASALHTVGINLGRNLPEGVTFDEVPLFNRLDEMFVNDTLVGHEGSDRVYGGAGRDTIRGDDGRDRLYGESGSDHLIGGGGNDLLDGSTGADRMVGGAGDDVYRVENRRDRVIETDTSAEGGIDRIEAKVSFSLSGSDMAGVEQLALRTGRDLSGSGNSLDNYMSGSSGDNRLGGGGGNDVLRGGSGNDILRGGSGADVLSGQKGQDTFLYKSAAESLAGETTRDRILDFSSADVIDLRDIDASVLADGDQAFTFVGSGGFTGAGQVRFETDAFGNTVVQADVDGNLTADFEILLQNYDASLTRDDFLL